MVRAFRALTLLLTVALAAACTVKNTPAPALSGPSELALSLTLAATPDILTQDGSSQSQVIVVARDASGKAVASVPIHLDITQGGQVVDYGTLSAKTIVTGTDGRATAVYTSPRAPVNPVDTQTVITLLATPIGSNYATSTPRSVAIRLVLPGVILPPSDLVAGFTFTPASPGELEAVVFTATPCSASVTTNCTSGSVASYSWDFGDGKTAQGQTVSHQFSVGSNYPVTLTIQDASGRAVSTTSTVTVKAGTNPTAAFTFSPATPTSGQTVYFDAGSSTAIAPRTIVEYAWTFVDGTTTTKATGALTSCVVHSNAVSVTLVVTDDAGRTGTIHQWVTVGTP